MLTRCINLHKLCKFWVIIGNLEEQTVDSPPEDKIDPLWVFEDPNDKALEKILAPTEQTYMALKFKTSRGAKYFRNNNPNLLPKIVDSFRIQDCVAKFCFGIDVNISQIDLNVRNLIENNYRSPHSKLCSLNFVYF